ncbi:hypothetical protein FHS14_002024 [Paenibacillus baekrokdamisoli]|uniref:hypothetical protein n=1 Tax=Paenibacillus baekrokdamisoli TaxID=1712516 RepID=UPI000F77E511|nr:hypothetical protein [Paenibacillus baekrokdamisoli]MBB3069037.1 hypothetical protein [Paenibacillus baekrokdamisoli]
MECSANGFCCAAYLVIDAADTEPLLVAARGYDGVYFTVSMAAGASAYVGSSRDCLVVVVLIVLVAGDGAPYVVCFVAGTLPIQFANGCTTFICPVWIVTGLVVSRAWHEMATAGITFVAENRMVCGDCRGAAALVGSRPSA